jgi:hypothetical protein
MKSILRFLCFYTLIFLRAASVLAQNLQTSQGNPINNFYVFTEGGAAYMPSIQFKDVSGSGFVEGVSFSGSISNQIYSTELGYDGIVGLGYNFNKNLAFEIEGGFISNKITNYQMDISGTIDGISGSVTGANFQLQNASIQQFPICFNMVVMNPGLRIRPMFGFGMGACPTRMDLGSYRLDATSIGAGIYDIKLGSYSACPFLIKLKAGIGYSLSQNLDIGLRGYANILAGADYGAAGQADVYTVVGVNLNLTGRF